MNLPTGNVTFLFTDIEGSTRIWEQCPKAMRVALARHNAILDTSVAAAGGHVFKTVGDAYCAVFDHPAKAVAAAVDSQRAILAEPWPEEAAIRVRMAIHSGTVALERSDYFGPALNRVARLLAIGHGGQVLVSGAAASQIDGDLPAGVSIQDRGRHRLRDLSEPEHVFQLLHADLPANFPPLLSLSTHPNNLPQQLTSFIGREKETEQLTALLAESRLVTVTGIGGSGKTRLALHVAADLLERFPDGVWLVELASLDDSALVPQAVANALGIHAQTGKPILHALTDHLKSRRMLVLLDNCEHLLDASAQVADTLLRNCPGVVILVTSREALNIAGEMTFRVPSLSIPEPRRIRTAEGLSDYEAVRLFVDRARMVQPSFAFANESARALASICYRLDGIPFAIELAAARIRNLSVEEVDSRLDQRFRLLTGGSRSALPRQQTLRSLIDWSYELLNDVEKALLCRLSVFSGGWSLEAAEQVCQGHPVEDFEILDLLTSLADKSLVIADSTGQSTRYRFLETVRQYAQDRLAETGDEDTWRKRHLDYFVKLGEEAEPHLSGADQQAWLERLDGEHDNMRAALRWAVKSEPVTGLRLAGAIWRFWYVRGHFAENYDRLEELLKAAEPDKDPAARASALTGAGVLAYCQGEYAASRAKFNEGLAIRRAAGDRQGIAAILNNLGNVAYDQADYAEARALFEESLALRRDLGEDRGMAATLNNLGNIANEQGDYAGARKLFEESLAIKQQLGDRWGMAHSLSNLGLAVYYQGNVSAARALFQGSLEIRREVGDRAGISVSLNNLGDVLLDEGDALAARAAFAESLTNVRDLGDRWGIAHSLEGLAAVEAARGSQVVAARLWGAAEYLREEVGAPIPPSEQAAYQRRVLDARIGFSQNAIFDAAWQEGRALPLDQAITSALEES